MAIGPALVRKVVDEVDDDRRGREGKGVEQVGIFGGPGGGVVGGESDGNVKGARKGFNSSVFGVFAAVGAANGGGVGNLRTNAQIFRRGQLGGGPHGFGRKTQRLVLERAAAELATVDGERGIGAHERARRRAEMCNRPAGGSMRGRAEFAVEDVEDERDSMVETRTVSRDGDADKPATPEEVDEIGRRRERDPFRHSRRHDRGGGQQGCGGGGQSLQNGRTGKLLQRRVWGTPEKAHL